jgi:hypothetical protein
VLKVGLRLAALVVLGIFAADLVEMDCGRHHDGSAPVGSCDSPIGSKDSGGEHGAPDCGTCTDGETAPALVMQMPIRPDRLDVRAVGGPLSGTWPAQYRPPLYALQ